MTYRCGRCEWESVRPNSGELGESGQLAEHAREANHPLCICCAVSLDREHRQTCGKCVGRVRTDLADIETFFALLPDELGNLGSPQPGQGHGGGYESPLLGGEALVLLGPGSIGHTQRSGVRVPGGWDRSHGDDEWDDDPPAVLFELMRHEDDWRMTRGEPAATDTPTITSTRGYLSRYLDWAANGDINHPVHPDGHPAFDEFSSDIQKLRTRLARATARDEPDERGVPCLDCGTRLVPKQSDRQVRASCQGHDYLGDRHGLVCRVPFTNCCDRGGLGDEYVCPRCKRRYSHGDYNRAKAQHLHSRRTGSDELLTIAEIRTRVPLGANVIHVWQQRGLIQPKGQDGARRNLYRFGDVQRLLEDRRQPGMTA